MISQKISWIKKISLCLHKICGLWQTPSFILSFFIYESLWNCKVLFWFCFVHWMRIAIVVCKLRWCVAILCLFLFFFRKKDWSKVSWSSCFLATFFWFFFLTLKNLEEICLQFFYVQIWLSCSKTPCGLNFH